MRRNESAAGRARAPLPPPAPASRARLGRSSRLVAALAALLLAGTYVLPLWQIRLGAPQYPEGLGLRIWIDRITGEKPQDLDSINNLNHYIGMHRIVPHEIAELRLMPWLVGGMIATGLLVALWGRRWLLYGWAAVVTAGAVAGLVDFWRWGYDYGHNLDPDAIIKIPGMSYQPPLIGGKQLLNFHAESWPAAGGWLAVLAVALALALAMVEWRHGRDERRARRALAAGAAVALVACAAPAPRRVAYGVEPCAHCHMTIADPRFAAQLVTRTGKSYAFDDIGCMLAFARSGRVPPGAVHSMWVNDYLHPDSLLRAESAVFLQTESLRTPMGSHLLATRPGPAADSLRAALGGILLRWPELEALPADWERVARAPAAAVGGGP